jgi:hypothetical protein
MTEQLNRCWDTKPVTILSEIHEGPFNAQCVRTKTTNVEHCALRASRDVTFQIPKLNWPPVPITKFKNLINTNTNAILKTKNHKFFISFSSQKLKVKFSLHSFGLLVHMKYNDKICQVFFVTGAFTSAFQSYHVTFPRFSAFDPGQIGLGKNISKIELWDWISFK